MFPSRRIGAILRRVVTTQRSMAPMRREGIMRRTCSGVHLCLGLTLSFVLLIPGVALALSQGPDEAPPVTELPPAPPPAVQAPQPTPAAQPAAQPDVRAMAGSCQSGVNAV